jgi:carboxymethylenebutenolidase
MTHRSLAVRLVSLAVALSAAALTSAAAVGCAGPGADADAENGRPVRLGQGADAVQALVFVPTNRGPHPAVIVLHEDRGLDDLTRDRAKRFAQRGYLALAVDLFRGQKPTNLDDAHIVERGVPEGRAVSDVRAAVTYLAGRPDVKPDRVAVVGWDMGGGYAMDAALADRRIRAVVVCYGRLTTEPETLKGLRARFLGIFGETDVGIAPSTVASFLRAMEKAGKPVGGLHIHPGVGHGFMSRPELAERTSPEGIQSYLAWRTIDGFLYSELENAGK